MDIKQIRTTNLRVAIGMAGSQDKLAEAANTSPSYLSQILNPTHKSQVGDKLARKIEDALSLPHGWMDTDHEAPENVIRNLDGIDQEIMMAVNRLKKKESKEDVLRFLEAIEVQEDLWGKHS